MTTEDLLHMVEHLAEVCRLTPGGNPGRSTKLPSVREAPPKGCESGWQGGVDRVSDSPRGVSPSRFLAPGPREPGFAQVRGHRVQPWTFEGHWERRAGTWGKPRGLC